MTKDFPAPVLDKAAIVSSGRDGAVRTSDLGGQSRESTTSHPGRDSRGGENNLNGGNGAPVKDPATGLSSVVPHEKPAVLLLTWPFPYRINKKPLKTWKLKNRRKTVIQQSSGYVDRRECPITSSEMNYAYLVFCMKRGIDP